MSAAIKRALMNLDKAVGNVETALLRRQKAPKNDTPDLFSIPHTPAVATPGFDRTMLAKKLDMTIARVEQLLNEA